MAKANETDSEQLGFLTRLDRLCRRILPGYNYIRNRRSGSRHKLGNHGFSSGFPNGNRDAITDEIFLGAGISKSEFCKELEVLLRKKLVEMQERMSHLNQGEAVHVPDGVLIEDRYRSQEDAVSEEEVDQRPEVSSQMRQRMIQVMLHQPGQEMRQMDTPKVKTLQESEAQKPSSSNMARIGVDSPGVSPKVRQQMIQAQSGQDTQQKNPRRETGPHEARTKKSRRGEPQPCNTEQTKPNIQTESKLSSDDINMEENKVENLKPEPEANPTRFMDCLKKFHGQTGQQNR
ncbi:hypothetical protein KR038_006543 [Drosophila bunnanda]|nr:hypothetical protein KR038_006543 [Drosophila bunnanda]